MLGLSALQRSFVWWVISLQILGMHVLSCSVFGYSLKVVRSSSSGQLKLSS